MKYNKGTGEKILDAAILEFEKKGFSGARMQQIANKAGINKALLHYYYKSKETLFLIIIKRALKVFLPKIVSIFEDDNDIISNIENFTYSYIETFIKNPRIPGFIIQEINNHPESIMELFHSSGVKIDIVKRKVNRAIDDGLIEEIEPEQLIINIISLCLYPFVAEPVIKGVILNDNKKTFEELMEKRKTEVAKFIIKAIKR